MKVLVACEESQAVTIELRKLGHEAYSCDIIECSGGHPEWYEFPVSDTQAYKMLGNGWTVDVIAHLITATMAEQWAGEANE